MVSRCKHTLGFLAQQKLDEPNRVGPVWCCRDHAGTANVDVRPTAFSFGSRK